MGTRSTFQISSVILVTQMMNLRLRKVKKLLSDLTRTQTPGLSDF